MPSNSCLIKNVQCLLTKISKTTKKKCQNWQAKISVMLRAESNTSRRAICILGPASVLKILHRALTLSEACGSKICLSRHIFTLARQLMSESIKANLWLLALEKKLLEKWAKKEDIKIEEPNLVMVLFPALDGWWTDNVSRWWMNQ